MGSELREKIIKIENELNDKDTKINKILTELEDYKIIQSKIEIINNRLKAENKANKMNLNDITDKYEEIQIKYDDIMSIYDINKNKLEKIENEKRNLQNQLIAFNKDHE